MMKYRKGGCEIMTLKNSVMDEMSDRKGEKFSSPEAAYKLFRACMEFLDEEKEHFLMLSLDTKNQLKAVHIISIGSVNATIVHPREVFKNAILESAAAILVGHNHPSGDPTPSQPDIDITKKLVESGKILGVEMYDHIVFGDTRFISMKDQELI